MNIHNAAFHLSLLSFFVKSSQSKNQCYEYRFGLFSGMKYFDTGLFRCTVLGCFGVSKKIKNNIYLYFLMQHKIIDPNK